MKKTIVKKDDLIEQGQAKKLIRISMAIAEDIGFDATGKPTKVNELNEIGAELAKFVAKEQGDE